MVFVFYYILNVFLFILHDTPKSIVLRLIYFSMFRKEEMNSELYNQLRVNSI